MLEVARVLASVSVILLIVAFAAWAGPLARLQLRLSNGSTANGAKSEFAALMLFAAVGLSAVAAILAIAWFAT
jgi:hypothetical protein